MPPPPLPGDAALADRINALQRKQGQGHPISRYVSQTSHGVWSLMVTARGDQLLQLWTSSHAVLANLPQGYLIRSTTCLPPTTHLNHHANRLLPAHSRRSRATITAVNVSTRPDRTLRETLGCPTIIEVLHPKQHIGRSLIQVSRGLPLESVLGRDQVVHISPTLEQSHHLNTGLKRKGEAENQIRRVYYSTRISMIKSIFMVD
jgi:hypothetical protein